MKYINLSFLIIFISFFFLKVVPIERNYHRQNEIISIINSAEENNTDFKSLNEILKEKNISKEIIIEDERLLNEYYFFTIWLTILSTLLLLSNFIYLFIK